VKCAGGPAARLPQSWADRRGVLDLQRGDRDAVAPSTLGIVYAVRQLACDALDNEPDPNLLRTLLEPATRWIAASVNGAASVDPAVPVFASGPDITQHCGR
jgi:hypothetical protein